jgi:hypothetical protein
MVSAVSSQAATLNPLAYTAQTDNDTAKQAASSTTATNANDSDRGPATHVSLSQAIQDFAAAGAQWGQDRLAEIQAKSDAIHGQSDAINRQFEISKINAQLRLFDQQDAMRDSNKASMERLQTSYDKWLNSPISPEVTLNATDAAKALKMLKDAGRTLPPLGPDMTYGFVKDGIQYNFRGDGTVTTRKEGIPTSEEDREKGSESFRSMMDLIARQLSDNTEARTNLTAQRDALMGQQPANA